MSIALWCLFIAGWLPLVCAGISKWGAGDFDNRYPREWLDRQQGHRKRAYAAQKNSWEAFAWFAVAVLVSLHTGADPDRIDLLAMVFIAARVFYIGLYLIDRATWRSIAWAVGFVSCVVIFLSGV